MTSPDRVAIPDWKTKEALTLAPWAMHAADSAGREIGRAHV